MPVSELTSGRDFYERLLVRPADIVVIADEVMWRLADSAWLYVMSWSTRDEPGTHWTPSRSAPLDDSLAELAERGINPASVEVIDGAGRKSTVFDPGGNSVAIGEVPS